MRLRKLRAYSAQKWTDAYAQITKETEKTTRDMHLLHSSKVLAKL